MKIPKTRAVDMVRRIRDRQTRRLAGKTRAEAVAFYRAAGETAMRDLQRRIKTRRRKAG